MHIGLWMGSGEIGGEAALADAGFAEQQDGLVALPGGFDRLPLALTADQPRRAQRGYRAWDSDRCRQWLAAFDQGGELARFGAGRGGQRMRKCLTTSLVRSQGGGAIAAPVVQPHHAPVRMLGGRRLKREALGQCKRFGDATLGFELG